MSDPVIAERFPAVLELEPGTYHWCRCGRSEKQPFCDGAHAGTDFRPLRVELEEPQRIAFCQCKRTGNEPRCDGSHSTLE